MSSIKGILPFESVGEGGTVGIIIPDLKQYFPAVYCLFFYINHDEYG